MRSEKWWLIPVAYMFQCNILNATSFRIHTPLSISMHRLIKSASILCVCFLLLHTVTVCTYTIFVLSYMLFVLYTVHLILHDRLNHLFSKNIILKLKGSSFHPYIEERQKKNCYWHEKWIVPETPWRHAVHFFDKCRFDTFPFYHHQHSPTHIPPPQLYIVTQTFFLIFHLWWHHFPLSKY